jgi:rhomboid family GlyGly-CTERM serine protease
LPSFLPLPSRYWPYLLLGAVIVLLAILPPGWQQLLQYHRSAIGNGEYWRLFSGHLLHSNYWHVLLNLGGLLLAMLLHGRYCTYRQLLCCWLLCALAISLLMYAFSPQLQIYVGLSGLLHAMLTLGALQDIQRKLTTGWLLLAGLVGKVLWEQWQGPDAGLAALINADVAIDAHLYGVSSGLLIAALSRLWRRFKTTQVR